MTQLLRLQLFVLVLWTFILALVAGLKIYWQKGSCWGQFMHSNRFLYIIIRTVHTSSLDKHSNETFYAEPNLSFQLTCIRAMCTKPVSIQWSYLSPQTVVRYPMEPYHYHLLQMLHSYWPRHLLGWNPSWAWGSTRGYEGGSFHPRPFGPPFDRGLLYWAIRPPTYERGEGHFT